MEENGSKEPVEAIKTVEDAPESPESEEKTENSAKSSDDAPKDAENGEKGDEIPAPEAVEVEKAAESPKDAEKKPETGASAAVSTPKEPESPEKSAETVENGADDSKNSVEAGIPENTGTNAAASPDGAAVKPAESKFKSLAPKERGKEGRVADRLAKRQLEAEKERGNVQAKWLRRFFSFMLLTLLLYFVAFPYLKTKFYIYAAQSGGEERFYWAVDKLADNYNPEAVSLYISGLQSKDKKRLRRYKKLIVTHATVEDREFIVSLLESKDEIERELGLKAFEILASKPWLQKEKELSLAVPMLIKALDKDLRPSVKVPRRAIIYQLGNESHKPLIKSLIQAKDAKERRNGLYVFHTLAHKEGYQKSKDLYLIGKVLTTDKDKLCRIYASLIFEKLKKLPEQFKPFLIQGTKDVDPSVRRICVETLVHYRDPGLVKVFVALLKDSTNEVGLAAISALAVIDSDPAIFALSDLYDQGNTLQRKKIVTVFNRVENPDTTRVLIRAMEDPDEQIAALATRYLGNRRSRIVDPALCRGLESDSPFIRIEATVALGARNVKEVIPTLIKNLEGEDMEWKELQALTDALQKLSNAKDIPEPSRNDKSWGKVIRAWKSWHAKQKGS
ncbi:MAG: HEAT repeat domain-containing protein [Planctomycetota bacterium]|nr:HEAT repeat domain-containing protein [Planctomycetota bacterium]